MSMFQIFVLMNAKQHKSRLLQFLIAFHWKRWMNYLLELHAREQCRCYGGDGLPPKGINYQHWREQMKMKSFRNGAKTDLLVVTGDIGAAYMGLQFWRETSFSGKPKFTT
jgi:hypothetical protein